MAVHSVPDVELLIPGLVGEVLGRDYMSAALLVGTAVAWRAFSYRVVFLPEDFVLADSCLFYQISEVLVSSVADQWLLCEFCSFRLVDLQGVPGSVDDLL